MHYRRWRLTGDLGKLPLTTEERFWSKVNTIGPIPDYAPHLGACWVWTAQCSPDGYGRFQIASQQSKLAHRFAWELVYGIIPIGLQIDHLCRVRNCVNPMHHELVTPEENRLRGNINQNVGKTHCLHGHPFDAVNTYVWRGKRACRTCLREADIRHREKNRAI